MLRFVPSLEAAVRAAACDILLRHDDAALVCAAAPFPLLRHGVFLLHARPRVLFASPPRCPRIAAASRSEMAGPSDRPQAQPSGVIRGAALWCKSLNCLDAKGRGLTCSSPPCRIWDNLVPRGLLLNGTCAERLHWTRRRCVDCLAGLWPEPEATQSPPASPSPPPSCSSCIGQGFDCSRSCDSRHRPLAYQQPQPSCSYGASSRLPIVYVEPPHGMGLANTLFLLAAAAAAQAHLGYVALFCHRH